MVYNRFFFSILFRVFLLLISIIIFAFLFAKLQLIFTQIILGVIIICQVIELTVYINKTNYELSRFISSVKNADYTINFGINENNQSFQSLNKSFNEFTQLIQRLTSMNESQLHFLNHLVDQVEFGIIVLDDKEQISVMNKHASQLLNLPKVKIWKNLQNSNTNFIRRIIELPESKQQLVEIPLDDKEMYFSVNSLSVNISDETYRIFSFQDIKSEIQRKEIEAWQKLIRILTHEIMNSVTPVISLTETIQMILQNNSKELKQLDEITIQNLNDINEALTIIQERGHGIISFVDNYKKITRVPKPELRPINISELVDKIARLLQAEFDIRKIELIVNVKARTVMLDQALIEQVIINILKNAISALNDIPVPVVRIESRIENASFVLEISNNGKHIPKENQGKIFIPFYTTKEKGSGIGLSISRQIVNAHGGSLDMESLPGMTFFTISIPS